MITDTEGRQVVSSWSSLAVSFGSMTVPRSSTLEHTSAESRPTPLGNSRRLIHSNLLYTSRFEGARVLSDGSCFVNSSVRSHVSSVSGYKDGRCRALDIH